MNLITLILVLIGLFFAFCAGIAYEAQKIEDAARTGLPHHLPGGAAIRAERWKGGADDERYW